VAQYSIKTGPLDEAGEDLSILAAELGRYRERVDALLPQLPEGTDILRRKLTGTKDTIYEISKKTRGIGMALYEIIDHYARAERVACGGHDRDTNKRINNRHNIKVPKIKRSTRKILFDGAIMPDWLKIAILKFEQSQN